jgi:hypothetical protein
MLPSKLLLQKKNKKKKKNYISTRVLTISLGIGSLKSYRNVQRTLEEGFSSLHALEIRSSTAFKGFV